MFIINTNTIIYLTIIIMGITIMDSIMGIITTSLDIIIWSIMGMGTGTMNSMDFTVITNSEDSDMDGK